MKTVLFLICVFLMPISAGAHPGKTDHRGGHKCWKNCGEWELMHGEYHLHDKDWNPIRLDRKGNVVEAEKPAGVPIPDEKFLLEEPVGKASGPAVDVLEDSRPKTPDVIVEKHQTLTIYEESVLPLNNIMLLLLAFFMLIVLIYVRKRREKE